MDQSQAWNWFPQGWAGDGPPTPYGQYPYGMQYRLPFASDPSWIQPITQRSFPQTSQPRHQYDERGRDYGRYDRAGSQQELFQASRWRQHADGRGQGYPTPGRPGSQRPPAGDSWGRSYDDGGWRDQGPPSASWDSFRADPRRRRDLNTRSERAADLYRPPPRFSETRPTPDQPQRQHEGGAWGDRAYRLREGFQRDRRSLSPQPPRAPASSSWGYPGNPPPAPPSFPMGSPAVGPLGPTRPLWQNGSAGADTTSTSRKTGGDGGGVKNAARAGKQDRSSNQGSRGRRSSRGGGDPITAPSAASGGVPEPTAEYLERASREARRLAAPKPTLVVIDLNGTLLHRPHKGRPSRFVERPLARAFLERCIDKYHVVIWSSARPENVRRMCAQLLSPAYLRRVVAVWGRDRFGLTREDYNQRTQCYKRLTRLWADPVVAASHPRAAEGATWSQADTVLIDDSAEKARSEPHNAVTLPEFAGDLDENPRVLPLVEQYLDALAMQLDVSAYIRANPFTVETASVQADAVPLVGEHGKSGQSPPS
ncbi:hypothetical protein VTH06DRAFT_6626 [Thermothelomyces fergusii]